MNCRGVTPTIGFRGRRLGAGVRGDRPKNLEVTALEHLALVLFCALCVVKAAWLAGLTNDV
jgi:hypothetical protein